LQVRYCDNGAIKHGKSKQIMRRINSKLGKAFVYFTSSALQALKRLK
jgi:hypothetical protein